MIIFIKISPQTEEKNTIVFGVQQSHARMRYVILKLPVFLYG